MKTTWLVVGGAAALWACDVVKVDPNLPYLKEADGGCAVAGQQPWSDGFCHLGPEGQTGGGAGGGTGGSVGGGTGGATGGGTGGSVDAGSVDAGPVDAGCQPTTCVANGWNCGAVDAGCGVQLNCGACDPARFEACGVGGVPNVCAPAEICSDDGWCWQNPLPQGNTLRAVWVNGPNDVWAGGDHGTLLHWDGEKWSRLPIQPPNDDIVGIASFGGELWVAAGNRILHRTGSTWNTEATGGSRWFGFSAPGLNAMFALDSANIWRRGSTGTWSSLPLPAAIISLTGLAAAAPDVAYIASPSGLFRYANGFVNTTSEFGAPISVVYSVPDGGGDYLVASNVVYKRDTGGVWTSLVAAFPGRDIDGGTMQAGIFPWPVRALAWGGGSDLWVLGEGGAQAHFDGGMLYEVARPRGSTDAGLGPALLAAHAGGGDVWSVGQFGTTWRLDGGVLKPVSAGSLADLNAVSAASQTNIWAVGGNGLAFQPARPFWTAQSKCSGLMRSVWADPNGGAYLLSDSQGCYVNSSGGVTPFAPTPVPMWSYISVVGPAPLYVVGDDYSGTNIYRGAVSTGWVSDGGWYDGINLFRNAWRPSSGGEAWFVSSNKIFAVHGDSAQVGFDSDVNADVGSVFGVGKAGGGNDVFVVGDAGYIGRRVGGASFPDLVSSSTTQGLTAGAGDGVGHGWIVGSAGTLLELQSLAATVRESGTSNELRGVASLPDAGVWVVGTGGTILHHR